MDNQKQIVYIGIDKLHPHYDNPRKDLGDLSELAESIKAKGVLQNLTVVPWFKNETGRGYDDNPQLQEEMGYIVVIGHRRLAAAEIAGLKEVPCFLSDMPLREQVATMLLENIQRSDLTIYEQAQGFQMMMNLGDTASDIAMRTGFSESTVRRRMKLLELDQAKFGKAVQDGATLMDFAELEKIEDIALRNKVLEDIGTSNFKWSLQRAVEQEKHAKDLALLLPTVESFSTKIENNTGMRYIRQWYANNHENFEIPEDAETEEYFFTVNEQYGYITLYQKTDYSNKTNPTVDPEIEQRNKNHAALEEAAKRAYQLRHDFVFSLSNTAAKKNMTVIIEFAMRAMFYDGYGSFDLEEFAELYDIEARKDEDGDDMEIDFADIKDQIKKQPEKSLLTASYSILDDGRTTYHDWCNRHRPDSDLDAVYDLLERLGYQESDEESQLQNGTHELFMPTEVTTASSNNEEDEKADLYACEAATCPFNDREGGCQFKPYDEDTSDGDLTNWEDDVTEAVEEHICQNPVVTEIYGGLASDNGNGEDD